MKYCVAIYTGPMSVDISALDKETALSEFKATIAKQWELEFHEYLINLSIDDVHILKDQS